MKDKASVFSSNPPDMQKCLPIKISQLKTSTQNLKEKLQISSKIQEVLRRHRGKKLKSKDKCLSDAQGNTNIMLMDIMKQAVLENVIQQRLIKTLKMTQAEKEMEWKNLITQQEN